MKNTVFTDILQKISKYFLVLVGIVVLLIACSGIRIVSSGSSAIILRFGKLVGKDRESQVHEPGLLFALPYMIDEVVIIPTGEIRELKVDTHFSGEKEGFTASDGYVITGDSNIAVVSASVKYTVSDPVEYALSVGNIDSVINASVSNALLECAASMGVDALLTSGKDTYISSVVALSQKTLEAAKAGVTVSSIELTNVSMPVEVRDTYEMVNSMTVEAQTIIEEANQYRERVIPEATSDAQTAISTANQAYSDATSAANDDLAEFWGVLAEYRANPQNTRTRIYSQKVSEFMGKIGTIRVVEDGETKIFLDK